MAEFSYNGVGFAFLHTRGVQSTPEYTPDRADYLGTDHMIRVEGVVHGRDGSELAAEYNRIRHSLEMPRGDLLYAVEGAPVLESGARLDISNGPHPELISLDQVIGTCSFHVSFLVKTRLWGCGAPPTYLSNRWQETVTIGPDHLSKVVRTGTLYTRASVLADTDAARAVVTPPPHSRFNRIGAEYIFRSDGMALMYTLTDIEVDCNPPQPAIQIDQAEYQESCQDGGSRYGECRVALTGRPRGDRKGLIATAVTIAIRRTSKRGWCLNPDQRCFNTMREVLNKNKVSVTIRALIPPTITDTKATKDKRAILTWGGAATGFAVGGFVGGVVGALAGSALGPKDPVSPRFPTNFAGWGRSPAGSDDAGVPDPGLRGTAGLVALSAKLNDPCLRQTVKPLTDVELRTRVGLPSGGPTSAVIGAAITVTDALPQDGMDVELSTSNSRMYDTTNTRMMLTWEEDDQVAHLAATDTTGTSAAVALASPTMQLVIDWTAERVGASPSIPSSDLGPNFVRMERTRQPLTPVLEADGRTMTVKTSGRMVFAVLDPSKVVVSAAAPPWVLLQVDELRARSQGQTAQQIETWLRAALVGAVGVESTALLPFAQTPTVLTTTGVTTSA